MRAPAPMRSVTTTMVVLAAVAAALMVCWHIWVVPITDGVYGLFNMGIDTRVYRGGAIAVWDKLPLYAAPVYQVWSFTYTPFAALTMIPLAAMAEHTAQFWWNVVNVICLVLVVTLSLRALRFRLDGRFIAFTLLTTVAATGMEPVRTTLWHGQINLVLAVLVLADLARRSSRLQGIGVGLAAGIKLTPIFFVAHLVTTLRYRAAAIATLTFLGTIGIGIFFLGREAIDFWSGSMSDTGRIGPLDAAANQSFNGYFARLDTLHFLTLPSWAWIPVGVVVGCLGLWAARRAYLRGANLLAISLTGMTSAGISPFSWGHHWVWVLPLLIVAIVHACDAARRTDPRTWMWWLAPTAIVALTFVYKKTTLRSVPTHPGMVVEGFSFGSFRGFGNVALKGWQIPLELISSGSYLIVLLGTIAVTLWWTLRTEPIRSGGRPVASDSE